METRAPYVIVGAFMIAVIAAVFGFVYWLHNTGGIGARKTYHVQFNSPVPGLLVGAAVLFNGIRVGEVSDLALATDNARQVNATIGVAPSTPIRADTKVGLDFQGLTGVPVIALEGGDAPAGSSEVSTLVADASAGTTMTQAARDALTRVDTVLKDNAEPLHSAIVNLSTFAESLARNTNRIDSILAGLDKMTGGGTSSKPKLTYDLVAAKDFGPPTQHLSGQLVIPEPATVIMLDTPRFMLVPPVDDQPALADAQWSDNIPKLVLARLVQSFENYDIDHSPLRAIDGVSASATLLIDIRSFQIVGGTKPEASVAMSARLLSKDGNVIGSKLFDATKPIDRLDAPTAAAAFNLAFADVVKALIPWTIATAQ